MRKLLSLLIILLLAGCYSYTTMPVHTMSDSQLQHEYLEQSSGLDSAESQLQIQRQSKDFQRRMIIISTEYISELRVRLAALRFEMSRRGLYEP